MFAFVLLAASEAGGISCCMIILYCEDGLMLPIRVLSMCFSSLVIEIIVKGWQF